MDQYRALGPMSYVLFTKPFGLALSSAPCSHIVRLITQSNIYRKIKNFSREGKRKRRRDVDGGKEHGCDELPEDSKREEGHS